MQRLRGLAFAVALLGIAPYRALAQSEPAATPSNIECVDHLEIPGYPLIARSARLQAIETVKVILSAQATIEAVESTFQPSTTSASFAREHPTVEKLFKDPAEKALKNSRFSKACGGKSVVVVFHFELIDNDKSLDFAFEPPNHYFIRSGPVYVNP